LANEHVQEEAAGLGQNTHEHYRCGSGLHGWAQRRSLQIRVVQQGHQQENAGMGVPGAEVGLLELGQPVPGEQAEQGIAPKHHCREGNPGDD
jgi:hypothetical protein